MCIHIYKQIVYVNLQSLEATDKIFGAPKLSGFHL